MWLEARANPGITAIRIRAMLRLVIFMMFLISVLLFVKSSALKFRGVQIQSSICVICVNLWIILGSTVSSSEEMFRAKAARWPKGGAERQGVTFTNAQAPPTDRLAQTEAASV
jgi:hypothetical protein